VRVLPLGDHVVDAIRPSSLARLQSRVRDDLRITLTVIKYAETMSQLALFRGTTLTRLADVETSDFHYGTGITGVVLRPIDNNGTQLAVDHASTSLSAVDSVAIVAVGPNLEEATSV
jgi:hypothetical protein